jgi:hypothetical protein
MTNHNILNSRAIVEQAVSDGIKAYSDSRRRNITPFIAEHFSFKGALGLNKCAFGKDLLRAPANLAWAPFYFAAKLGGGVAKKVGMQTVSEKLKKVKPGFRTDVEKKVEWLMYSEFLELPFVEGERVCDKNALLTFILAEDRMISLFEEKLLPFATIGTDSKEREKLEEKLSTYVDNRKDVAELTTAIMGISAGLAAHKGLNMGAIGLGQTAAAIAQHLAISNFFLGQTLGGLYFSVFPTAASMGLIVGATGGIAAAMGIVSAFAGVIADPVQKSLGLHHKKLRKLVDAVENQLLGKSKESYVLREGLVARLLDFIDILANVAPKAI